MPPYRRLLPELWEKSGGICALCDKPMEPIAEKVHIDHIIPRSRGGTNDVANLQAVHMSCNSRKGHRPMAEAVTRIRTTPVGHHQLRPWQRLVSFHVDAKLLEQIDNFWFDNRYPTRSAAVRAIIDMTLDRYRLGVLDTEQS